MSVASIVLAAFAGVLLLALLLAVTALLTPVVFTVDSASWQLRIRFLAALEFWMPLPGRTGKRGLAIAGMPVQFPQGGAKHRPGSKPAHHKQDGAAPQPRKRNERIGRFLRGCVSDSAIRGPVAKTFARLLRGFSRSVTLTRRQIHLSLADPAWNGILAAWLARSNRGRRWGIHVNFIEENSFFLEARLYPYRIVRAALLFSRDLPYRALLREWRASSAAPVRARLFRKYSFEATQGSESQGGSS